MAEHIRGWLLKWTNYIKGYQKRWFVLTNGLLSYYRSQEEMSHTCRGTVNLAGAFIDTIDTTNFVITNGPQVYYLRAVNEVERQRWVTVLTLAKAKAIKHIESDSDGENGVIMTGVSERVGEKDREEGMVVLKKKMKELSAAHDVVIRNSHLLLKQLTELERGGHIKHGGDVNTTPGGRNEGGVIDASLRGALLIHVGHEHAVNAAYINNKLGNPLLLRRPLDCGVKVIGAHCATEGTSADLDNGGVSVPCFNLFLRLMREDKYKDLLFGDISATCAFRRLPYLKQLLQATDIHDRLVYGSDYPVPAINLVVHTSRLLRQGFITQDESTVLNELYNYNPLLFDFACKRLVTGPTGGERFPSRVFKAHSLLPPFRHDSNLLGTPV